MRFLSLVVALTGVLLVTPGHVESAKILAIYPSIIRSQLTVAEGILEALAEAGNDVTLVSPYRFKDRLANMQLKHEIHLEGMKEFFQENFMSDMFTQHTSAVEDVSKFIYAAAEIVNYTLSEKQVQDLLQSKEAHFDLVMIDHFLNDAFLGFGLRFNAPVVITSSSVINKWIERSLGNPHNPAYNPHQFLGYTHQMSFWQRIINVVVSICEDFSYDLLYLPVQQSMYQRFFGKHITAPLPPLEELIHNVSLALVYSDRVFHGVRALLPNVIEMGGVHIAHQPPKPLPKDISHYFSIADDGIFLMTLGASVRPSTLLMKEKLAAINHVIRKIPTAAAFIRWDHRLMEYQSDNAIIGLWIPQNDMLADPKVRLLITNGGLLSIYEAIFYKKPLIIMPLFGDQFQNAALVEEHGIGRIMNMDNITVEYFEEILTDVRTNPVYLENLNRLHHLMFGQNPPDNRLQQAVNHIKYVIETQGAGHLRAPSLSLSVWQLYLIDVSATLILIVFVILAVPAVIIGVILRRVNSRIGHYEDEQQSPLPPRGSWTGTNTNSDDVSAEKKSSKNHSRNSSAPTTPSSGQCPVTTTTTRGGTTLKKRN